MFLNKIDLAIKILKCDKCKIQFDDYCLPKLLPCFKTICTTCEVNIHKEAINKRFKCGVCSNDHYIPDDGLVLNEKIYALLKAKPIELSRGEQYRLLFVNLDILESSSRMLKNGCENGTEKIKEHCDEQIRLVQLATENTIVFVNNLSDDLIEKIRKIEAECTETYLKNKDTINKSMESFIGDVAIFIKEKNEFLNRNKIDDAELKEYNEQSEEIQESLDRKLSQLEYITCKNEMIVFKPNLDLHHVRNLIDELYRLTRNLGSKCRDTIADTFLKFLTEKVSIQTE
jgi:hypothetical protein